MTWEYLPIQQQFCWVSGWVQNSAHMLLAASAGGEAFDNCHLQHLCLGIRPQKAAPVLFCFLSKFLLLVGWITWVSCSIPLFLLENRFCCAVWKSWFWVPKDMRKNGNKIVVEMCLFIKGKFAAGPVNGKEALEAFGPHEREKLLFTAWGSHRPFHIPPPPVIPQSAAGLLSFISSCTDTNEVGLVALTIYLITLHSFIQYFIQWKNLGNLLLNWHKKAFHLKVAPNFLASSLTIVIRAGN